MKGYNRLKVHFLSNLLPFCKIQHLQAFFDKFIIRRLITMKNEKLLSTKIKDGVKKGLFATLKANANSSGCYIIYQPKTPKGFEKFKNIK